MPEANESDFTELTSLALVGVSLLDAFINEKEDLQKVLEETYDPDYRAEAVLYMTAILFTRIQELAQEEDDEIIADLRSRLTSMTQEHWDEHAREYDKNQEEEED